jgi:hypothetical protein
MSKSDKDKKVKKTEKPDKKAEKVAKKLEKKKLKEAKKLAKKEEKKDNKEKKAGEKAGDKAEKGKPLVLKKRPLHKALMIGINYTGTDSALNGCINDTLNLSACLQKNGMFTSTEIVMMNDTKVGTNMYPTKKNIMSQLETLVQFAKNAELKSNDPVYILVSYSGHGTYVADTNGDEVDKKDEALCPIDYDQNGPIVDDEINEKFISRLPKNVKLVMFIDACHSGTCLDLKYNYTMDSKNTCITYNNYKDCLAEVTMISGCKDPQTSADAFIFDPNDKKNEYQGAMTGAFLACYLNKTLSSVKLINDMRKWLKTNNFDQIPQFSSGKSMDTTKPFPLGSF